MRTCSQPEGGTKGRTLLCPKHTHEHAQRGGRELGRGAEPRDGYLGLGSCQLTPGHRSDPRGFYPPLDLTRGARSKRVKPELARAAQVPSQRRASRECSCPQPQPPPLAALTPHEQRRRGRDPKMSSASPAHPQGLWGEDLEGSGESSTSPSRGQDLPQPLGWDCRGRGSPSSPGNKPFPGKF